METVIGILLLFLFLIFGMPIGFSLLCAGTIGILLDQGPNSLIGFLATVPYRTVAHYTMSAIPLFIFMAELISHSGLAAELFEMAYKWLGRLPERLAVASIIANAFFGAMSGSSAAAAAVFSKIAVPAMKKQNYSPLLSTGTVALAGTLAILIPPSIPMIVYATATETSVGKLLIAGIIPGILSAIVLCGGIIIWVTLRPGIAPRLTERVTWKEKMSSLVGLWPTIILIMAVLGSMYAGIATPTEAAAVGAAGSLVIGLALGRISFAGFIDAVRRTVSSTIMIFTLVIGAMVFAYFLTISGVAQSLIGGLTVLPVPPWVIMLIIVLIYVVLGMFLDVFGAMLISLPILFPVIVQLGFDPVWFGIVVIVMMEIALVTPPVGVNVFIVAGNSGEPLEVVFKGAGILLIFEAINLLVVLLFPELSLFLPHHMFK